MWWMVTYPENQWSVPLYLPRRILIRAVWKGPLSASTFRWVSKAHGASCAELDKRQSGRWQVATKCRAHPAIHATRTTLYCQLWWCSVNNKLLLHSFTVFLLKFKIQKNQKITCCRDQMMTWHINSAPLWRFNLSLYVLGLTWILCLSCASFKTHLIRV